MKSNHDTQASELVVSKNIESATIFKNTFKEEMLVFKEKVNHLSSGETNYSNRWRDTLIVDGVSIGILTTGTTIAVLGMLGVITSGVTAGVGLAVAIVGIVAIEAYNYHHSITKQHEYTRAATLLNYEHYERDVDAMADKLARVYKNQLKGCTETDATALATACFAAVTREMRKNRYLRIKDLLKDEQLQVLLFNSLKHVKDAKLHMTGEDQKNLHVRGMVKKAGLYCAENSAIYSCKGARPEKYGMLFFQTKDGLEEYMNAVAKAKNDKPKWKYEKLHPRESKMLIKLSLSKLSLVNTSIQLNDHQRKSSLDIAAGRSVKLTI